MSKVYTINNGESEANQIPSIEYLNELKKMIVDAIVSYNAGFNGFPSIKMNTEELPIGIKEIPTISASEIETDSEHRFVNESILNTMVDKPTKFEIERSLDDTKLDLKSYMDNTYMQIVNTPNVVNKLRDISTILNEDEIANGLLDALSYKLNLQDFEEHTNSSVHMTNNDRKALNILLKCAIEGFADWNAKDGTSNAVKNKPESLPANGGNADTIANHGIKDLINKDDYDLVIGTSLEKYSKDSCDIYADRGFLNVDAIESLEGLCVILFKRGHYTINTIGVNNKIINGVDCRLSWIHTDTDEVIQINKTVFKNIGFDRSKIIIKSDCEFKDVKFANCEIAFDNSVVCKITDCVFDKCTFRYEGNMMNNIIKFNRYIHTKPIVYIGNNNIISENIY